MFKYLLLLTIAAQSCLDASGHGLGRKRAVFKKSAVGPIQGKDQAQQAAKLGLFGKNAQTPANTTTMDGWTTLKNAAVVTIPFDVLDDDADKLFVAALTASDFADINAKMVRIDGWRGRVQAMRKQHASLFPVYYWTLPFENQDLTAISCVEGAPMDLITGHYVGKLAQNQHPLDGINNQRSFNVWTQTAKPVIFGEQFPAFMYSKKGRQPEEKNIIQNTGAQGLTLLRANIKEAHVQYIADYPQLFEGCIDAAQAGKPNLVNTNMAFRASAEFIANQTGKRVVQILEHHHLLPMPPVVAHSPKDLQANYNQFVMDLQAIFPDGQKDFFLDHTLYFLTHGAPQEFAVYLTQRGVPQGGFSGIAVPAPQHTTSTILTNALGADKAELAEQFFIQSGLLVQAAFAQLMIPYSGQAQDVRDKALQSLDMLWPSNHREHLKAKATDCTLLRYALAPTLYPIPLQNRFTTRKSSQMLLYAHGVAAPAQHKLNDLRLAFRAIQAPAAVVRMVGYYTRAVITALRNSCQQLLAQGGSLHASTHLLNHIEAIEGKLNRKHQYLTQIPPIPIEHEYPDLNQLIVTAAAMPENDLITALSEKIPNHLENAAKHLLYHLAQRTAFPLIYSQDIIQAIHARVLILAQFNPANPPGAANLSLCGMGEKPSLIILANWLLRARPIALTNDERRQLIDFHRYHHKLNFAPRYLDPLPLTFSNRFLRRDHCLNGIPVILQTQELSEATIQQRLRFFTELKNIVMEEIKQYA